jgi:polyisoprenoid-binding protein YceI
MRSSTAIVALVALTAICPILAGEQTLRLDPSSTQISFTLEGTLHDVHGSLFLDHGEVRFDMETGQVSGEIVLDALRTVSGNAKRDKKMHKKVLESQTFPEIRFSATRIEGRLPTTGTETVTLHGKISIHGDDHDSILVAQISRDGDRLHATLNLSVPFVEWGMVDPSFLFFRVAKVVEVSIEMDGTLE